jgi:hypothetical protein
VLEYVNLQYYRELEQRRGIFTDTRARFVTGSKRSLWVLDGGYIERDDAYSTDIDIPLHQEIADGGLLVDQDLTERITMTNSLRFSQQNIDADPAVAQLSFDPVDRRSVFYDLGFGYLLRPRVRLTGDFNYGRSKALEEADDRTTQYFGVLIGIGLTKPKLSVGARVGIGLTDNLSGEPSEDDNQTRLLASANIDYNYRRVTVGVFFNQRFEFTILSPDATYVTSVGARAAIRIPISDRLSFVGSYIGGYRFRHDNLVIDGEQVNNDFFQTITAGLDYKIYRELSIIGSVGYHDRDTDLTVLRNQRWIYSIGVGYNVAF